MTRKNFGVPGLLASLRSDLESPDPIRLLQTASNFISIGRETPSSYWSSPVEEQSGLGGGLGKLMDSLLSFPSTETDSLLVACAEMLGDSAFQTVINEEVKPRLQVMPAWLAELSSLRVKQALSFDLAEGGEETIALEVEGPRGGFTLMVDIETLGSPYIEDAYAIRQSLEELTEQLSHNKLEDLVTKPLTLEEARARLESALQARVLQEPPLETQSWPKIRPLLEWQLHTMPEGGEGYASSRWGPEELRDFLYDFKTSRHAFGFLDWEDQLVHSLANYAYTHGTGDARQWGPRLVARALKNVIVRKRDYSELEMQSVPRVLGAMVMYGHEALGVPDSSTQQVLDAISDLLPSYLGSIRPDIEVREQGRFGGVLETAYAIDPFTLINDAVGGEDALEKLNADPLPTGEPLAFEGVPEDVSERVKNIGELVGKYAAQYFQDPEMVTAAHRTLHLLATRKPDVFRRRSKDLNTAAVVLYITGHNNRWFDRTLPDRTVLALGKMMGVKAISWDRAFNTTTGLHTKYTPTGEPTALSLGRPELLTSTRRKNILQQKRLVEDTPWDYNPWDR